jgi:autotransporter-associated beta strand protein
MKGKSFGASLCAGLSLFGSAAFANHHFMQIEQVIGGVDGDTTAQAIQLRMRAAGQQFVQFGRIRAFDATGSNPILLHDFTTSVANGTTGARVLIASQNFANYLPGITPDFVMSSLIPAPYLNGGRITFEDDAGTIWWSLAFGTYTGSNLGNTSNDVDGNFGPPFSGVLPSSATNAVYFPGPATALSTNNLADYLLSGNNVFFRNNGGFAAAVISDAASTNYWDINGTAAGAGGTSPAGSWNGLSQNFNTDSTGGAAGSRTGVTSALDTVVFAAGNDATGTYTVTLSGTRSASKVVIEQGAVALSGGTLACGSFEVQGGTCTVTSTVTGGSSGSLLKTGPGVMTLGGTPSFTGGTTVGAGELRVTRLHDNNAVTINTGAKLKVVDSAPNFPSHPAGSDATVSRPRSLTINGTGTLDLGNNDMIIAYGASTPYAGASPAAALEE